MDNSNNRDGYEVDNSRLTPDGKLGWWHIESNDICNCIPAMDLYSHRLGETCWCAPELDLLAGELYHRSADGREKYENGAVMH